MGEICPAALIQMNKISILLVDDDATICQMLALMLSDGRRQVQISQSVAEAGAAIEEKLFDIYVVDYNLTDGTGLDLAGLIRSKGSGAPIIVLSGCDPNSVALRAEELRIFDIVAKPFSRATICNAVEKAIGALAERKSLSFSTHLSLSA
jgi:DNA-binding NtrC family response regulator